MDQNESDTLQERDMGVNENEVKEENEGKEENEEKVEKEGNEGKEEKVEKEGNEGKEEKEDKEENEEKEKEENENKEEKEEKEANEEEEKKEEIEEKEEKEENEENEGNEEKEEKEENEDKEWKEENEKNEGNEEKEEKECIEVNKDKQEETIKQPKPISNEEKEARFIFADVGDEDAIFENGYKEREYTKEELEKLKYIESKLDALPTTSKKINFLKKVAQEPHGFVGGKVRSRAWAILLNLSDDDSRLRVPPEFLFHALRGSWITQVLKDTQRSLHEWVEDNENGEREHARRHLTSIIVKVLELGWLSAEHADFAEKRPKGLPEIKGIAENVRGTKELYYFQGFHDIASTVMLTTNSEELSVNILYTLARGTLAPLFEKTLYPTLDIISGIFKVIDKVDAELSAFIKKSAVTPDFALSWVLTWFSHNVRDLAALQRIFDYLIASQDTSEVVLLSVAYILSCRAQLLRLTCDRDYICMFFRSGSPAIVLSAKEAGLEIVNAETTKPGGCVEVDTLISDAVKLKEKLRFKFNFAFVSCVVACIVAVGIGVYLGTQRK